MQNGLQMQGQRQRQVGAVELEPVLLVGRDGSGRRPQCGRAHGGIRRCLFPRPGQSDRCRSRP